MSLLQDKNFRTRAITGALFVGVIVACIFIHWITFFALVLAINFFCLREFYHLTLEKEQKFFNLYCLLAGLLPCLFLMFSIKADDNIMTDRLFYLIPAALFLILFIQLFYDTIKPFGNIAFAFLGLFYISIPMCFFFLNTVHFDQSLVFIFDPWFALLLFILVWINDTGAYITGVSFGRTKLIERISPKKTLEGTLGGVALCILVAALYGKFVLHESPIVYGGLGLVIGIFSTLGDLIESQLKRSLNIKDSGTMLPGHGGFLDRFDGFLMAMPAAYLYMLLVR